MYTSPPQRRPPVPFKNPTHSAGDPEALKRLGEAPSTDVVAKRITLNLSSRSHAALERIVGLTEDSKTETINKALQVYAMIQERQARGGGAWLQDDADHDPVQGTFF
jgi:hypothetical protein